MEPSTRPKLHVVDGGNNSAPGASPSLPEEGALERQLAALREAYALELPARVAQLAGFAARAREHLEKATPWLEGQSLAHRLRGTAGCYGFHGVSAAAGALEDALYALGRGHPTEETWHAAERAVRQLQADDALIRAGATEAVAATPDASPGAASAEPAPAPSPKPQDLALNAALSSLSAGVVPEETWQLVESAIQGVISDDPKPVALKLLPPEDAATETLVRSIHSASAKEDGRPMGTRVLLVEDDLSFLEFAALASVRQLIQAVPARSLEEALVVAQGERLDAALIDLHLPDGSGLELAQRLRALPGCARLPIGFMSADSRAENRVAAMYAGGSLFLAKPLDVDMLGTAVRQLVQPVAPVGFRVLMVDDDPALIAYVSALLSANGMQVVALDQPAALMETLRRVRPEVLLLDESMPGIRGFDVCRMLRGGPDWRQLAIVMLTSSDSGEDRLRAYRDGADDFISKSVLDEELVARVQLRAGRARMMEEQLSRDGLTGLLVRGAFHERLAALMVDADRREHPLSLCLLDLDHFRMISAAGKYLAADQVLAALGRLLSSRFRATDLRARWEGAEFVLAFPDTGAEVTAQVVRRVLEEFSGLSFSDEDGGAFNATFSAGVASFPADGSSLQELFTTLERRLGQAKSDGRSQVCCQG